MIFSPINRWIKASQVNSAWPSFSGTHIEHHRKLGNKQAHRAMH